MALVRAVTRFVPGERICLAHFNHKLRADASDGDEAFVRETAARLGAAFKLGLGSGKDASEEALRNERRAFLRGAGSEWGAEAILTAHHGSDQFETFLMRVLRGAGLDGLGGIRPNHGGFARPFLGISRAALEEFARATEIEYRDDHTNATDRYLRNRVRRSLVPAFHALSSEFGGEEAFLSRFSETIDEIQAAAHWLGGETDRLFDRLVVPTPLWLRVRREELLGLSSLWPSRLVGRVGAELGVAATTRAQRERVLGAVQEGGKFELAGGVRGEVSCGEVFFFRPGKSLSSPCLERSGNRLNCAPLGWTAKANEGWLDGKRVRFFEPGDRFEGKKLKEWWLERRIPAPERALIPLVAVDGGSEVMWIFPQLDGGLRSEAMDFPFSFLSPRRNSPVVPAP